MGTNEIAATSSVPRAPGGPAVLARLPAAVEYTYIKMILMSVLPAMYWVPWLDPHTTDPTWVRFGRGTFRAVDRILRREEQRLAAAGHGVPTQAHDRVRLLRHLFVQHLVQAVRYWDSECATRWIEIRLVSPPPDPQRPRRFEYREWVLDAWARRKGMPHMLEQVVVPPGVPPWGDERVLYYDPVLTDARTVEVVRRHFPEVMGQRIGQGWRSERAPGGWPMLTQKVIPALYDYLHPFYAARSYRKEHLFPTAGDYPTQLLQDITDILRLEMPHIATLLTVERVQAAVQRYLEKARPDRRMGVDLFAL
jgi:hypothetical protein